MVREIVPGTCKDQHKISMKTSLNGNFIISRHNCKQTRINYLCTSDENCNSYTLLYEITERVYYCFVTLIEYSNQIIFLSYQWVIFWIHMYIAHCGSSYNGYCGTSDTGFNIFYQHVCSKIPGHYLG